MAASPVILTQKALFINADTGVHSAANLRRQVDPLAAPGVLDYNSWRVRQRVAGAAMSVDVTDAATISQAYVRGSSTNLQGMYYLANAHPTTGTIDALVNVDIAAADPANPRIDQVFLCVEDAQHSGANNQASIRVVSGTATGGATLDNRTGVGAAPASSILLADILVPAASVTVVTANIRDRRPVGNMGTVPWNGTQGSQLDMVAFEPHFGNTVGMYGPGLPSSVAVCSAQAGTHDNLQASALCWLPRRIVGATRIRFSYAQFTTANAGNFALWVADASGRVIAQTAATAFTGAASSVASVSVALTATTTFEAGWYYVGMGIGAMTAVSAVSWPGIITAVGVAHNGRSVAYANIAFRSAAGGTTVPTTIPGAAGDITTVTGAQSNIAVPLCALSVT